MPDKMHLEGGPKIGPLLAESEEESFSQTQHMSGFAEAPAGSRYAGPSGPVTETGRFRLRNWGRFLLHSTVTDNRFLLLPMLTLSVSHAASPGHMPRKNPRRGALGA